VPEDATCILEEAGYPSRLLYGRTSHAAVATVDRSAQLLNDRSK
jgi:hypothetical protein